MLREQNVARLPYNLSVSYETDKLRIECLFVADANYKSSFGRKAAMSWTHWGKDSEFNASRAIGRGITLNAIAATLVVLMLAFGLSAIPNATSGKAYASDAESSAASAAKPTKSLKQLGVKFDLKKGKTIKFNVFHATCGNNGGKYKNVKQPYTVKVTSVKVTKAKKKGYKKAVVTMKFSSNWKPSNKIARGFWNANCGIWSMVAEYGASGHWYVLAVDGKTGVSLDADNEYGVTTKGKESKIKYTKKYKFKVKGWTGCEAWFSVGANYKMTITYPETYKDLCLGVGGTVWTTGNDCNNGTNYVEDRDRAFYRTGGIDLTYSNTTFYKKGRKNFHFMQIK